MEIDLNIKVFTTKQVVVDKQPIRYVVHDDDGEWEFLTGGNCSILDAMLVSMAQLLELDKSIEQILSMPPGMEAYRSNKDAEWEIEPHEGED